MVKYCFTNELYVFCILAVSIVHQSGVIVDLHKVLKPIHRRVTSVMGPSHILIRAYVG